MDVGEALLRTGSSTGDAPFGYRKDPS